MEEKGYTAVMVAGIGEKILVWMGRKNRLRRSKGDRKKEDKRWYRVDSEEE